MRSIERRRCESVEQESSQRKETKKNEKKERTVHTWSKRDDLEHGWSEVGWRARSEMDGPAKLLGSCQETRLKRVKWLPESFQDIQGVHLYSPPATERGPSSFDYVQYSLQFATHFLFPSFVRLSWFLKPFQRCKRFREMFLHNLAIHAICLELLFVRNVFAQFPGKVKYGVAIGACFTTLVQT